MLVALPAAVLTLAALGPRSGDVSRSPYFAALLAVLVLSVAAICALVRSRIGKLERTIPGRRTYALVLLALAIAMITAAAVGRVFRTETAVALRVATPVEVTDALGARWTFASQGLSSYNEANRMVTALALDLARDGKPGGIMSTEIRQYVDVQGAPVFRPAKEAAIRSSLREDVYVVLHDIEQDDSAMLTVAFHPLMAWLWVGGCLLALGGMLYTWPARSENEA
jgi:cytochrome c-type biogenesis protein CcmF